MIFNLLKRIIERGDYDADDLKNKLDVFYRAGKITEAQRDEMLASIQKEKFL
mgnify:CR=1 FL=1